MHASLQKVEKVTIFVKMCWIFIEKLRYMYKCSGSSRYDISKSQKVNGNSKYQSLCKKELFRSPLRVNYVVALNLIRILL